MSGAGRCWISGADPSAGEQCAGGSGAGCGRDRAVTGRKPAVEGSELDDHATHERGERPAVGSPGGDTDGLAGEMVRWAGVIQPRGFCAGILKRGFQHRGHRGHRDQNEGSTLPRPCSRLEILRASSSDALRMTHFNPCAGLEGRTGRGSVADTAFGGLIAFTGVDLEFLFLAFLVHDGQGAAVGRDQLHFDLVKFAVLRAIRW